VPQQKSSGFQAQQKAEAAHEAEAAPSTIQSAKDMKTKIQLLL